MKNKIMIGMLLLFVLVFTSIVSADVLVSYKEANFSDADAFRIAIAYSGDGTNPGNLVVYGEWDGTTSSGFEDQIDSIKYESFEPIVDGNITALCVTIQSNDADDWRTANVTLWNNSILYSKSELKNISEYDGDVIDTRGHYPRCYNLDTEAQVLTGETTWEIGVEYVQSEGSGTAFYWMRPGTSGANHFFIAVGNNTQPIQDGDIPIITSDNYITIDMNLQLGRGVTEQAGRYTNAVLFSDGKLRWDTTCKGNYTLAFSDYFYISGESEFEMGTVENPIGDECDARILFNPSSDQYAKFYAYNAYRVNATIVSVDHNITYFVSHLNTSGVSSGDTSFNVIDNVSDEWEIGDYLSISCSQESGLTYDNLEQMRINNLTVLPNEQTWINVTLEGSSSFAHTHDPLCPVLHFNRSIKFQTNSSTTSIANSVEFGDSFIASEMRGIQFIKTGPISWRDKLRSPSTTPVYFERNSFEEPIDNVVLSSSSVGMNITNLVVSRDDNAGGYRSGSIYFNSYKGSVRAWAVGNYLHADMSNSAGIRAVRGKNIGFKNNWYSVQIANYIEFTDNIISRNNTFYRNSFSTWVSLGIMKMREYDNYYLDTGTLSSVGATSDLGLYFSSDSITPDWIAERSIFNFSEGSGDVRFIDIESTDGQSGAAINYRCKDCIIDTPDSKLINNLDILDTTVEGSEIIFENYNQTSTDNRIYTTYGNFRTTGYELEDTRVRTNGTDSYAWKMTPTSANGNFEYVVDIPGAVANKPIGLTGYMVINCSYFGSDYDLPTVTLSEAGISGSNVQWAAENITCGEDFSTSEQQFSVFGTTTSTGAVTLTISIRSNIEGEVIIDDISVMLPETIDLGKLDIYKDGKPLTPPIATGLVAGSVWDVITDLVQAENSTGEALTQCRDNTATLLTQMTELQTRLTEINTSINTIPLDVWSYNVSTASLGNNTAGWILNSTNTISDYLKIQMINTQGLIVSSRQPIIRQ